MKLLISNCLMLFIGIKAYSQTIPDPSNASALALLKASPELKAKLNAFKLNANEVDFKFAGNQHMYSAQCEYIKNVLPHDYYVVEFLGTCKKNNQHDELTIRSTVEYRRSNSANSCKLDNVWKHAITQVWDPKSVNGTKSIANANKLLIDFFSVNSDNFKVKLNYGYNDVVSIKNFETQDIVKCPNGYDILASDDGADKKTNIVIADVLEMKMNSEKNGIRALRWNKHVFYVKTQTTSGVSKIVSVSNEELGSCNTYPPKILYESQTDYDTLYAGAKDVGFSNVYNKINKKTKSKTSAEGIKNSYNEFHNLLIDVLSGETKLKDPERLKKYLGTKFDTGYDSFINHFLALSEKGFAWSNARIIDNNTMKYDYRGVKLLNKKLSGDKNISIGEAGQENGEIKFTIMP